MGLTHDVTQKVKGELQKAKGEVEMKNGKKVKGAWDKTKGAVNTMIADANLKGHSENA